MTRGEATKIREEEEEEEEWERREISPEEMKEMSSIKSERVGREEKTRCEGGAKTEEIPSSTAGFLSNMECSKWLREPL